uniref:Uncharacterized protein n=1 Tax=Periophthalmus magnuspinnatus TaxID=409849 RepID=A0A3B4ATF8_9GOBI
MASTVATPMSLTSSDSVPLSSPGLSPSTPGQLSPDDVELLAKLEEVLEHINNILLPVHSKCLCLQESIQFNTFL